MKAVSSTNVNLLPQFAPRTTVWHEDMLKSSYGLVKNREMGCIMMEQVNREILHQEILLQHAFQRQRLAKLLAAYNHYRHHDDDVEPADILDSDAAYVKAVAELDAKLSRISTAVVNNVNIIQQHAPLINKDMNTAINLISQRQPRFEQLFVHSLQSITADSLLNPFASPADATPRVLRVGSAIYTPDNPADVATIKQTATYLSDVLPDVIDDITNTLEKRPTFADVQRRVRRSHQQMRATTPGLVNVITPKQPIFIDMRHQDSLAGQPSLMLEMLLRNKILAAFRNNPATKSSSHKLAFRSMALLRRNCDMMTVLSAQTSLNIQDIRQRCPELDQHIATVLDAAANLRQLRPALSVAQRELEKVDQYQARAVNIVQLPGNEEARSSTPSPFKIVPTPFK